MGQHYKCTMCAHCKKLIPILIDVTITVAKTETPTHNQSLVPYICASPRCCVLTIVSYVYLTQGLFQLAQRYRQKGQHSHSLMPCKFPKVSLRLSNLKGCWLLKDPPIYSHLSQIADPDDVYVMCAYICILCIYTIKPL